MLPVNGWPPDCHSQQHKQQPKEEKNLQAFSANPRRAMMQLKPHLPHHTRYNSEVRYTAHWHRQLRRPVYPDPMEPRD